MGRIKDAILSETSNDILIAGLLLVGLTFAALALVTVMLLAMLLHMAVYVALWIVLWALLTLYVRRSRLNESD